VVTITLVSATALVVTFGLIVANSITEGLVDAREAGARAQVDESSNALKLQVGVPSNVESDPYLRNAMPELLDNISRSGPRNGFQVAVIPTGPTGALLPTLPAQSRPHRDAYKHVPSALREKVAQGGFWEQRALIDIGDGAGERLYLVFGRLITAPWGELQTYYFYPLDEEVEAAGLVRNTLLATGAALVLLLAMLAAVMTRLVVNPVRVAARTAQRLSAGLLDQRMEVRGEDDLAALAASFNQMAENLQRHIQRLEEMSRLQRRFTSDVSHELRTPLTTVRMAADLIFTERASFDPVVARSAELLHAELDRFEGLLTDLLEISRFDAGFAVLDAEPADVAAVVRRVVDRLVKVADRAGVVVEVDVPATPVIAEVDSRRIERVLRNLIGNAVDHGEGRPVRVRLAVEDGAVAVTVRDYGVGLRPGEEKLVFNRFWRADPSRARQTGGTGLGLSISLEDVHLHGGWLEAWGAPGQGAQFRLTLPTRAGEHLASSPLRLVPTDAMATSAAVIATLAVDTAAIEPAAIDPAAIGAGAREELAGVDAALEVAAADGVAPAGAVMDVTPRRPLDDVIVSGSGPAGVTTVEAGAEHE
jgi:two-component system sensor histidine kinase MtrB